MIHEIRIDLDVDAKATAAIISAIKKMGLTYRDCGTKRHPAVAVYASDPVDFYYLGANVVAEAQGIFKGPITT